jgi:hypothetical protein
MSFVISEFIPVNPEFRKPFQDLLRSSPELYGKSFVTFIDEETESDNS